MGNTFKRQPVQLNEPNTSNAFISKINLVKQNYHGLYVPTNAKYYLLSHSEYIYWTTFDNTTFGIINQTTDTILVFQYPWVMMSDVVHYDDLLNWLSDFVIHPNIEKQRCAFLIHATDLEQSFINQIYRESNHNALIEIVEKQIHNTTYRLPNTNQINNLVHTINLLTNHTDQILRLPQQKLTTDELCMVCSELARDMIYMCGHYCICQVCYEKIGDHCPICRKHAHAVSVYK